MGKFARKYGGGATTAKSATPAPEKVDTTATKSDAAADTSASLEAVKQASKGKKEATPAGKGKAEAKAPAPAAAAEAEQPAQSASSAEAQPHFDLDMFDLTLEGEVYEASKHKVVEEGGKKAKKGGKKGGKK